MTIRERFRAAMFGEPLDRLPVVEWAPYWDQTLDRWHTEGLPAELSRYEVQEHFGLDPVYCVRITPLGADCPAPPKHGAPRMPDPAKYDEIEPTLFPDNASLMEALREHLRTHDREDFVL